MEYKMKCLLGDVDRILVTDEFVQKNNLSINQKEAIDILKNSKCFFGFDREVAIEFISTRNNESHFHPDYIKDIKKGMIIHNYITDPNEATQDFLDYMVFAWKKAMDERGISASRSIYKLSAWMRILNRTDISNILIDENLYNPYGRPALRKACEN